MTRSAWTAGLACLAYGACTLPAETRLGEDAGEAALDGALPAVPIEAGAGCEVYVADPLIEHACFHALEGPYRDRVIDGGSHAADLSRAHTAFRLVLPASGENYEASLRYAARFSGGYALFTSSRVELTFAGGQGHASPSFAEHDTEICPELPWVRGFRLKAGEHHLRLQSPTREVTVVIEFMDEGATESSYRVDCAPVGRSDAGAVSSGRDAATPGPPEDGGEACWIDPVLEHSCLHAMRGPFESVTSASSASAPNVDLPHTAFMVALPGSVVGHVSYRPGESGEYAFYLGADVELALRDSSNSLAPTFVEPVAACAGLAKAFIYDLVGATKYDVSLTPAANEESTTLIIENVDSLVTRGWSRRLEACE